MCCPGNRPSVVASGQPLPTSAHLRKTFEAPTRPLPGAVGAGGLDDAADVVGVGPVRVDG